MNMNELDQRRVDRRSAQQLFDTLAPYFLTLPHVNRGSMFGSNGLRIDTKFFAFIGRDGQLVIKLPAEQAAALVSAGEASPIRAGRNITREWIGVPCPTNHTSPEQWQGLLSDAYHYAALLAFFVDTP